MPIQVARDRNLDGHIPTQSPYWLNFNGAWMRLDGVTPGSERSSERPRSELVTVDGHRYTQQAPRYAREWNLDYQYATPATIAALALAAEAHGQVWLVDEASSRANMLEPRSCYGTTGAPIDAGGIPLLPLATGVVVDGYVRDGVVTTVAAWSTAVAGTELATLTFPGGTATLTAAAGVGPQQATATIVPFADGPLTITVAAAPVSGLMVVEGDPSPTWLAGERMPCTVAVQDPSRTLNLLRSGRQSRSDYSVTLLEVG